MSEFDPRGGQLFSKMSEIQKSLNYPRGGGWKSQAYLLFCKKNMMQAGAELSQAQES